MEREQFTFYRSFWEAAKALPVKERGLLLGAVCDYALNETEPGHELKGPALAIYTIIKPILDSGRAKATNRKNKTKTNEEQTENKTESKAEQE